MEPNLRQDRHAPDLADTNRPDPKAEQTAFTPPFATEGLEQLRDSHC
jgi:hypothetical protein